ncbi:hypothetical protein CBA19CS11_18700 [Caballeronia novacaledonica]|nr:hypothetical protein CBA19CS11_18700 [Caballeronia novacaledonica]
MKDNTLIGLHSRQRPGRTEASSNRISILRATNVSLLRDFKQLFAELVECHEKRPFIGPERRLQVFERCAADLERDFPRLVVTPEKHAMPGSIVASARIRKMKRHSQPRPLMALAEIATCSRLNR